MTAIDRGTGRGIDRADLVAVVGTGTMGQGIAQVALAAGHPVRLYDAAPGRASRAADAIADRLGRLVAKEHLTAADRDAALGRLTPVADLADLAESELVVEAILEELDAKRELFTALESVVSGGCLLATNTSSLSVTAVAGVLRHPGRLLGLHFFNPAPLMPLVEVVRGAATDETAVDRAHATVAAWGKTPVRCADTPGFIVNRIARPFYAEAFRAYEERAADPATLDAVLRGSGGFRMGPFELTDLIGQDVNEAVTRSVWEALSHDPKFTPSLAQRQLVASGRHGRKTGHGWYDHSEGAGRTAPHTAEPCEPPGKVALHGDLGPAQGLVGLIEEAGIPVTREPVGSHLALPDGTRLSLADGTTATGDPFAASVRFDLALDYRTATRVALAASMAAPRSPCGPRSACSRRSVRRSVWSRTSPAWSWPARSRCSWTSPRTPPPARWRAPRTSTPPC
ncbi:3-hydroxyacyl-CoA dehydrogenase [Streptomyces violaceusniger]|uniref:3-hydroxyacyl-CoA dehydrogenase n=1 Tax=Streptomyces violaceusniger TaxID=68280 RepID=A0A4D4LAS8_STRVO|nr:3-hydroxyacyl-CoA dehydrogenase [Streptomyces violaceusniger]